MVPYALRVFAVQKPKCLKKLSFSQLTTRGFAELKLFILSVLNAANYEAS